MKNTTQIQKEVISEFGSDVTQEKYTLIAEEGLWQSEEVLIKKYFKPNSSILDVGCGTGRTTILLHQMGYQITGVDITPQMIATAKKIAQSKNLNINYQIGDATNLKFQDNSFDNALFANNGWTQIPGKQNRLEALKEIYRILKPGGHYIFTAHKRYYSGFYLLFWIKQWIKFYILKSLGFKIKEIDFGDRFFTRNVGGKKLKQKQYIHISSTKEVKEQIKNSGFKLIYQVSMGEISKIDADSQKATLTKKDNAAKSPIFYVCEK